MYNQAKELGFGKKVRTSIYQHIEAIKSVDIKFYNEINYLARKYGVQDFNVVKFNKDDEKISLLWYPNFFVEPHPALDTANTINLKNKTMKNQDYSSRENAPILHRKETFLEPGNKYIEKFSKMTAQEEKHGLYDNPKTIGTKLNWQKLLDQKGLMYLDHSLIK